MSTYASKWVGVCDVCGEGSPEERNSAEEAQADADECPCRAESDAGLQTYGGNDS